MVFNKVRNANDKVNGNNEDEFQKVANILRQIKSFISHNTDTNWAGFENADLFLKELNIDIGRIEACDYQTLEKIHVEFLPTGTYQELSISNGWGEVYLKLSSDFDKLYEKLTQEKKGISNKIPKVMSKLWNKLFGFNKH